MRVTSLPTWNKSSSHFNSQARVLPTAKPLPKQQQILLEASPQQLSSLQHSSSQLQPQQQPDQVAGLQQLADAAAAASEPVLQASVNDKMPVKLHKLHLLLANVLACTDCGPSFVSSIHKSVSKWDGSEVNRFHSTTYAYLSARYLAEDAPAMCVVMDEILKGII